MSLVSQAVIVSTCKLLMGRTWAGDRVMAQPVDPIAAVLRAIEDDGKPVLAVYIESAEAEGFDRMTQGKKTTIELKIYVYLPPGKITLPDGANGASFAVTRAGLCLDMISRQVDAALHNNDGPWLETWKKFVTKVTSRKNSYVLVEIENGVRVPTVEISYSIEAIPDPHFGVAMTVAWQRFDTELRADGGEWVTLADLFHDMITKPTGLTSFEAFQANYGLTDAAFAASGLALHVEP